VTNCRTLRVLLDLVSMRQIILLHLVCDNMSHPLRGIYILCQCDITSQPPSGAYYILCHGPCSTYHILCQCDQLSQPPFGGCFFWASMSMRHIVAPPSGVLHLVARFAVHVPHIVAVDNSPPFGGPLNSIVGLLHVYV